MMREEFEQLTGIYPTEDLYDAIEMLYYRMRLDKYTFCERFRTNDGGLAETARDLADESRKALDERIGNQLGLSEADAKTLARIAEEVGREAAAESGKA